MKIKMILLLCFLSNLIVFSQKEMTGNGKDLFDKVYNSYSPKKNSIVILKDGKKIEGLKKDVDRKKGQIYYIKIQDKETGKKLKFESDEIKEMYLYPGGLEKFGKMTRHITDVRQWERTEVDNDVINQGYIYFKNQMVSLKNKKKEKEYLMQLINPTFSKYVEVFGDPFAKETMKLGIGGLNVAGGLAKSYYLKKNGKIYWLNKKELDERYESIFGDCPKFMKHYPVDSIKWRYFSEYILEYTKLKSEE